MGLIGERATGQHTTSRGLAKIVPRGGVTALRCPPRPLISPKIFKHIRVRVNMKAPEIVDVSEIVDILCEHECTC